MDVWLDAKRCEAAMTQGRPLKCVCTDDTFKLQCYVLVEQHTVGLSSELLGWIVLFSSTLRGQGGGRETGDLCPSVTHAALGLMLMENEMFKSLAEKYSSL